MFTPKDTDTYHDAVANHVKFKREAQIAAAKWSLRKVPSRMAWYAGIGTGLIVDCLVDPAAGLIAAMLLAVLVTMAVKVIRKAIALRDLVEQLECEFTTAAIGKPS